MDLQTNSDSISAAYAIVLLVVYSAFPFLSYTMLVLNFKNLHEKDISSKIDTLYEGTNINC